MLVKEVEGREFKVAENVPGAGERLTASTKLEVATNVDFVTNWDVVKFTAVIGNWLTKKAIEFDGVT